MTDMFTHKKSFMIVSLKDIVSRAFRPQFFVQNTHGRRIDLEDKAEDQMALTDGKQMRFVNLVTHSL